MIASDLKSPISPFMVFQRKAFYALRLHWVFYTNYTHMVYITSSDGTSWEKHIVVREAMYGYQFSVWFDETYVHYALKDYTMGIWYRRGLINHDGTISWEPNIWLLKEFFGHLASVLTVMVIRG